jgi:hypothetical protein
MFPPFPMKMQPPAPACDTDYLVCHGLVKVRISLTTEHRNFSSRLKHTSAHRLSSMLLLQSILVRVHPIHDKIPRVITGTTLRGLAASASTIDWTPLLTSRFLPRFVVSR